MAADSIPRAAVGSHASSPAALSLPALPAPWSHARRGVKMLRGHHLEPWFFSRLSPSLISGWSERDRSGSPRDAACCSPALAAAGVSFSSSLQSGNQRAEQKPRTWSTPRNTVELPTAEGRDGKMVMGSGAGVFARWANLPVQTRLLVLLRNPVDALLLLLLALRCAARAQAGPRCRSPADSILYPAWAKVRHCRGPAVKPNTNCLAETESPEAPRPRRSS